jgi:hypothetical protein
VGPFILFMTFRMYTEWNFLYWTLHFRQIVRYYFVSIDVFVVPWNARILLFFFQVHQMFQQRMNKNSVIVGTWSSWSRWSPCTRSCGGGVAMQTRDCQNAEKEWVTLWELGLSQPTTIWILHLFYRHNFVFLSHFSVTVTNKDGNGKLEVVLT